MSALNPFGDGAVAASADSIEIPKGNPGRIEDASNACKKMAHQFDDHADAVISAGNIALDADWGGRDSNMFSIKTMALEEQLRNAGRSVRRASSELRTFAHVLERAQQVARRARRDGRDAQARAERALDRMNTARAEAVAAETDATQAGTALATARASADAAGATDADRRQTAARNRATGAHGEARSHFSALLDANGDVIRAVEKARDANDDARRAALAARGVLEDCADQVPEPLRIGPAPVPVTPTYVGIDITRTGTLKRPFRGLTPGDIRRSQQNAEAEERRRQIDAQPSGLERLGVILANEVGGLANGLTLGGANKVLDDIPGVNKIYDPDSPGAKYGEAVSWLTAAGLIKNIGKNGLKKISDRIGSGGSKAPSGPNGPAGGTTRAPAVRAEPQPDGSVVFRNPDGTAVRARVKRKPPEETTASKGPERKDDGRGETTEKPDRAAKLEKKMDGLDLVRDTADKIDAIMGMPPPPPQAPPHVSGIG